MARSTVLIGVAAAIALAAGDSTAMAAESRWTAPLPISAPDHSADLWRLAAGNDGTVAAVWSGYRVPRIGQQALLQVSIRPPGEPFGAPVNVPGVGEGFDAPQLAMGARGEVVVVWREGPVLRASRRWPGGAFTAPVEVAPPSGYVSEPQVAITAQGSTIVAWWRASGISNQGVPADDQTVLTSMRPPGERFGAPVRLSAGARPVESLDLAIARDGTATVIWNSLYGNPRRGSMNWRVQASTRRPGRAFGAPVSVSSRDRRASAHSPRLAVAPDGTTTAVWRHARGGDDSTARLLVSTRTPRGGFGRPVRIPGDDRPTYDPLGIAVGRDGTTTAIWRIESFNRTGNPLRSSLRASTRRRGGRFGRPATVPSPDRHARGGRVVVDSRGTTTVVFAAAESSRGPWKVLAASRRLAGRFGSPVEVSPGPFVLQHMGPQQAPEVVIAGGNTVTSLFGTLLPKPEEPVSSLHMSDLRP